MGIPHSVNQQTVDVVERCGKFNTLMDSGLHCLLCCFDSVAGTVSLRLQQLDVTIETKTKDNVFVFMVVSVQYQVSKADVYKSFYHLTDARQQITAYVFDVVRASVPKLNLDDVFEQKDDIALAVKRELNTSMADFGFVIHQALVTDVAPDPSVKKAMNEINAARRMRDAAVDKAEAEKILIVKSAEAEAESKYLAGVGIARQRKAIIDGFRESVVTFSESVQGSSAKDVMDVVLLTQYFDTLKEMGGNSKNGVVFMNHSPGAVSSLKDQLSAGFMEGMAGQSVISRQPH